MLAFTKTCIDNNTNSGLDYVFLMCVNQDYRNYSWFIHIPLATSLSSLLLTITAGRRPKTLF
jgi:hypothetical protein